MIAALKHRGPDGEGVQFFPACALGHSRLSIVDIAGGAQPMVSMDGQLGVIFNGEIYGYKDLRADLRGKYCFRTQSDTEVLLALYEGEGLRMLDRVPGMFAFALWDERRRELFCARDRFGEKPFFYAFGRDGEFVFGSEIKAILASGLVDAVVDADSVAHYLQYLYVHPHHTIYRNVHVLPPAHRLFYRDGGLDIAQYWTLPPVETEVDADAAVEEFRHLLSGAVARQLVADVPVGAFLSGGLDSSTIVALVSRQQGRCRTFSFGFGPVIDEIPFARQIAERYRTGHTELSDGDTDVADLLIRMAEVYDEPFGDSSNIPTFLLCREARRHVKVALTGEGSDELLGGYSFWYRTLFDMERAASRAAAVKTLARVIVRVCRRAGIAPPRWAARTRAGTWLRTRFPSLGAAHSSQCANFSDEEVRAVVPACTIAGESTRLPADTLDDVLRSDLVTYLPGDILVKADRASMAHGLELRAPFLDWEFASFCASLPARLKITDSEDKVILRRGFEEAWTPAIRRRGKQGFGAPVTNWLQRPSVRELSADVLENPHSRVYDVVSPKAALAAIAASNYQTWALLVLALWAESARAGSGSSASAIAVPVA